MAIFSFSLNELVVKNDKHVLHIEGIKFVVGGDSCAVALIGDSGMGKTTIFKSLFPKYIELWNVNPQHRFSANHSFNGSDFTEVEIQQNRLPLRIGFANQLPYFLEDHTASENIFFPLRWTKTDQLSEEERSQYIAKWKLNRLAESRLSILSGGERQMVNLARAMVINPDVVIIDECFSSMNEKLAESYITLLKNEYSDVCFIVTSHRHSDIEHFECEALNLKKERARRGCFVVTLEG